ncbi:MAG TPA: glycosyltransferase family 9 protein [Microlunatus sp.]|nr:glycosyltransferase family 9 protein [Microlunatus sp.]
MPPADSVLVLRALGLGDLLTAVPALRALRRGFPDSDITLGAPAWLAPLLPLTGAVDQLLPLADMDELGPLRPAPDLAINLHGRGPQSIAALRRTGAERIISHRHPDHPDVTGPEWTDDLHEVRRWCRLAEAVGLEADPADLRLAPPTTDALVPGAVVVHPGASSGSRRWPWRRFATVAAVLAGRGHSVVVTGTTAEAALCQDLVRVAELPAERDLAGRLDLDQLAALAAAAELVLCGDTGVAHLASAYGIPSVLLFGPTSPTRWGPPPDGPHTVLWSGSVGDPHAAVLDPGLDTITVDDVLTAVDQRLAR